MRACCRARWPARRPPKNGADQARPGALSKWVASRAGKSFSSYGEPYRERRCRPARHPRGSFLEVLGTGAAPSRPPSRARPCENEPSRRPHRLWRGCKTRPGGKAIAVGLIGFCRVTERGGRTTSIYRSRAKLRYDAKRSALRAGCSDPGQRFSCGVCSPLHALSKARISRHDGPDLDPR